MGNALKRRFLQLMAAGLGAYVAYCQAPARVSEAIQHTAKAAAVTRRPVWR